MHRARRLESYWAMLEGHLLRMLRERWNSLSFHTHRYATIDLADSPLQHQSPKAEFLGAAARRISEGEGRIFAFGRDPDDCPDDINVYRCIAIAAFPAALDLGRMLPSSDTDMDAYLEDFLDESAFITKNHIP